MIPIDTFSLTLTTWFAVNLGVLVLFAADKRRARLRQFRIPERTLLLAALIGPAGALAGMRLVRHKTRKPLFAVAVPLFAAVHAAIIIALLVAAA